MAPQRLSPVKVIVTGHADASQAKNETNPDYRLSTITSSSTITPYEAFQPGGTEIATYHIAQTVPTSNDPSDPTAISIPDPHTIPRPPPNGALFCTADYPPGVIAPIHRTNSTDYGVVVTGEITIVMEDGSRSVIRQGEMIVQRGAMHEWRNEGSEWCRIAFVMVGAEKLPFV